MNVNEKQINFFVYIDLYLCSHRPLLHASFYISATLDMAIGPGADFIRSYQYGTW